MLHTEQIQGKISYVSTKRNINAVYHPGEKQISDYLYNNRFVAATNENLER
jgi:hypothetical protein